MRSGAPFQWIFGLKVRVRPNFVSYTGQGRKTSVEVTSERDGDMRSPEGGPDLEPSLL